MSVQITRPQSIDFLKEIFSSLTKIQNNNIDCTSNNES